MSLLVLLAGSLVLLPTIIVCADEVAEPFTPRSFVSVEAVSPGMEFPVLLTIDIAPHHYIYHDSLDLKLLDGKWISIQSWKVIPAGEPHPDTFTGEEKLVLKEKTILIVNLRAADTIEAKEISFALELSYQGCSETICFLPQTKRFSFSLPVTPSGKEAVSTPEQVFEIPQEAGGPPATGKPPAPVASGLRGLSRIKRPEEFLKVLQEHTFRWGLLACFILGLATSLTPCVYPLIGITVALIAGQAGTRSAFRGLARTSVYVLGLSITFAILGTLTGHLGSKVQIYLQGSWIVLAVAAIFVVIALSMFGLFSINLPRNWASKITERRDGGILWTLFVGLASGLVATPCVSAFLGGVLLFVAVTASAWKGFWLLFAFGWGMGMLLIAVGTSSGFLKALPQPGAWMKTLEHFFGWVLLLAAAFFIKPLIPDTAYHVTVGLLFFFGGVFAGGVEAIPAGAKWPLRVKKGIAILAMIFGAYLAATALIPAGTLRPRGLPEGGSSSNGINWRTDALEAIEEARQKGKPVMIDFWIENCPACDEMDREVFLNGEVIRESRRFVAVKVDSTRPRRPALDLNARYGILGFPTVVFLDSSGKVSLKVVGFSKTKDFLKAMKGVH